MSETPRALDGIREDITDLRAELQAIKTAPQPAQGASMAQVEQKLNTLAHTMMEAVSGAFKERLQVTEKRIDEVAEDAKRHTDGSLADIRSDASKALMGIEAASIAGVAARTGEIPALLWSNFAPPIHS